MTGGGRLRRRARAAAALGAALGAALLVVAPSAPAGAAPVITIDTPVDGKTLDNSKIAVSGQARSNALTTLKDVTLKVGDKTLSPTCDGQTSCDLSWSPTLPTNGAYELAVSATEQTLGVLGGTKSSVTRKFVVDAPPAKPVVDAPKVSDARTVALSWSRNTEPDMLYYAVFRKDPGGSAFLPVGRTNQPESGSSVSFADATTTLNGGEYAYQVVAVRKGGAKPETASAPSAARTVAVPLPPTTTLAPQAPGAPPGPGQPGTTVKPGAAAGVDLSGFLASRAQAAPTPPPTILEPPDPGFKGSLPFDPAAGPANDLEEGNAEAIAPPSTGRSSPVVSLDSARPLVPVAGGLILLLLAVHMRLLNRRLKPAAAGDLPIETAAFTRDSPPVRLATPAPEQARSEQAVASLAASVPWTEEEDAEEENWEGPSRAVASGDRGMTAVAARPGVVDVVAEPVAPPSRQATLYDVEEHADEVLPVAHHDVADHHPADDEKWQSGWSSGPGEPVASAEPEEAAGSGADLDPDGFEVEEVISPTRRPLVRSGNR